jgi:nitrous oxide reductase
MNKSFHSRRHFIKSTALVSVAGLTMPAVAFGSCVEQEKKKLGVALVGLGNYSNTLAKAEGG